MSSRVVWPVRSNLLSHPGHPTDHRLDKIRSLKAEKAGLSAKLHKATLSDETHLNDIDSLRQDLVNSNKRTEALQTKLQTSEVNQAQEKTKLDAAEQQLHEANLLNETQLNNIKRLEQDLFNSDRRTEAVQTELDESKATAVGFQNKLQTCEVNQAHDKKKLDTAEQQLDDARTYVEKLAKTTMTLGLRVGFQDITITHIKATAESKYNQVSDEYDRVSAELVATQTKLASAEGLATRYTAIEMPQHTVQHEEACTMVLELATAFEASEQVYVDQMAKTEAVQAKCTRYAQLLRATLSQNAKLRSRVTGMSAFLSLFVAFSLTLEHSLGLKEARYRSLFKRFLDTRILLVMRMQKASARIRGLDAVVNAKMAALNTLQAEHTATSSSYDDAIKTANDLATDTQKKLDAANNLANDMKEKLNAAKKRADLNHDMYVAANDLATSNHKKLDAANNLANNIKKELDAANDLANDIKKKLDAANDLANDIKKKLDAANDLANANHEKFATEQTSRTNDKQTADTRYLVLEQSKNTAIEVAEANYTILKAAHDKLRESNTILSTSVDEANIATVNIKLTLSGFASGMYTYILFPNYKEHESLRASFEAYYKRASCTEADAFTLIQFERLRDFVCAMTKDRKDRIAAFNAYVASNSRLKNHITAMEKKYNELHVKAVKLDTAVGLGIERERRLEGMVERAHDDYITLRDFIVQHQSVDE